MQYYDSLYDMVSLKNKTPFTEENQVNLNLLVQTEDTHTRG